MIKKVLAVVLVAVSVILPCGARAASTDRFEDFCKTGRTGNSGRWDSSRNYILSGGCAEGGPLCAGNAKGC